MNNTANYGLVQYEEEDKFRITQDTDSLNKSLEIIDTTMKANHDDNEALRSDFETSLTPVAWAPELKKSEYIKIADGSIAASNKYARTKALWDGYGSKIAIVLTNSDFEFCIAFYDSTGALDGTGYLGHSNYKKGTIFIPNTAIKFGVSFRREDQASLTNDDVAAISAALSAYAPTDDTLSIEGMAADAKATGKGFTDLDIAKAPTIEGALSTEAPIQEMNDAAAMPMKVVVGIDPVQDLHGYDYPWPGGGGKNLFNKDDSTLQYSGYIEATSGLYKWSTTVSTRMVAIPCKANTTYIVSNAVTTTLRIASFTEKPTSNNTPPTVSDAPSEATTAGTGLSITTGENDAFLLVQVFSNDDETGGMTLETALAKLMVEEGSTAHTWEPYENICPISGWTGCKITRTKKNLFGGNALKDKLMGLSGATADGDVVTVPASRLSGLRFLDYYKENTQYTFFYRGRRSNVTTGEKGINLCFSYTDGTIQQIYYHADGTNLVTGHQTSTAGKTLKYCGGYYAGGDMILDTSVSGLFEGKLTEEDFEPYQGDTYDISFPAGAGTVYGGTLTVNKDGSGILIVDKCAYTFGISESITKVSSGSTTRMQWYKSTLPKPFGGTDHYINSHFKNAVVTSTTTSRGMYCYASSGNNFPTVTFRTREITSGEIDAAGFKQWLKDQATAGTPLTLVYDMETPMDPISLTPGQVMSLLGYNAVWCDTGDIKSIDYCSDIKLYVSSLAASEEETQAIINEYEG